MTDNPLRALDPAQIEQGWKDTFSTENPFCACDLRTFTKAARWAESVLRVSPAHDAVAGYVDGSSLHELKTGRLNVGLFGEPIGSAQTPLYTTPPTTSGNAALVAVLDESLLWIEDVGKRPGMRVVADSFVAYIRQKTERALAGQAQAAQPKAQEAGRGVVPPAAEPVLPSAMNGGVTRLGDWAIPKAVGCMRIVDERMAYGWNECRKAMLEAQQEIES